MLGDLPVREPLWQRALRQREAEQVRERVEAARRRERVAKRVAKEQEREQKRAALER